MGKVGRCRLASELRIDGIKGRARGLLAWNSLICGFLYLCDTIRYDTICDTVWMAEDERYRYPMMRMMMMMMVNI